MTSIASPANCDPDFKKISNYIMSPRLPTNSLGCKAYDRFYYNSNFQTLQTNPTKPFAISVWYTNTNKNDFEETRDYSLRSVGLLGQDVYNYFWFDVTSWQERGLPFSGSKSVTALSDHSLISLDIKF
jgi:hypothetical protein